MRLVRMEVIEVLGAVGGFGVALNALRTSGPELIGIARAGWNGQEMFVALIETGDLPASAVDGRPVLFADEMLFLKTADGEFVPWCPSQTDILAHDWELVFAQPQRLLGVQRLLPS
jgi:hypothetical protein